MVNENRYDRTNSVTGKAEDTATEVVCFGEVLWDSLPEGLFLGGAPLNVAAHLVRLGVPAAIATAVGDDVLGSEAIKRIADLGIATDLVQTDCNVPTGFVDVELQRGSPAYEIRSPAAWDHIVTNERLLARAGEARALVFGTLSQRGSTSSQSIAAIWQASPYSVLDVNLRAPYYNKEVVDASLEVAHLVKLNEEELRLLAGWYGWSNESAAHQCASLAHRFDVSTVAVTRGPNGAALLHEGAWSEDSGEAIDVADTVGAGDAFLAGLLSVLLSSDNHEGSLADVALRFANRLGGLVASRRGAIPPYGPQELVDMRTGAVCHDPE